MGVRLGSGAFHAFNYLFFSFLIVLMLYPFVYIVMHSLSGDVDITSSNLFLYPQGFTWEAYGYIFEDGLVFTGYKNSLIVTGAGTLISLSLTCLMAYPMSKSYLPGKKLVTAMVLFTFIFHGGLIPTYLVVKSYGLVNTLWALMLPSAISIYNLLIMTRFFRNIPASLIESASIDGYNDLSIFWKIVLPLSKPVLAAIALFYAVSLWNAFLPGIIYVDDSKLHPIQVILYNIVKANTEVESEGFTGVHKESIKMAVSFVSVLPIILLYPYLQKYFVQGMMLGSVKE